jgi:GT2 family glycosyltransferase
MSRVAAVFATMNRRSTAETCLGRLAAQTRPPDRVVVADNGSSDGTVGALDGLDGLPFPLEVLDLNENLGNAGGIERAMERAFEAGADAVWILDDDSWPEPGALEALVAEGPAHGVRASLVVDPATGRPSWPFQVRTDEGWSLVERTPDGGRWIRIRRAWLGALVPREVREKVGPVLGALFLRGEDEDYPRRIENAGCPVYLATDSILHHPPGGRLHVLKLGASRVVLEAGLPPLKLYYRLRNSWWLTRRDQGRLRACLLSVVHLAILIRQERPVRVVLRVWKRALADAFSDRLGRLDDAQF